MVFESVVADLLNRFLGSYVDNLNANQLNIGIWGGDVKLNNLEVKESALDEFDLPVKLKFGYIQSLVLKIPWKKLYTEPTIVDVSGLYMIIVPNQGIVYNEQKTHKNNQEAKQKRLARLEENRRNRQKPKSQSDDTFTEKLVAQVIKNLQIRIKRVHVRYEDKFSNRNRPFATGITMNSLDFQTTDENFKLMVQRETVKLFYKFVSLNSLSVYSNANSSLISDLNDKNAIIDALKQTIVSDEKQLEGYKYLLAPLSISAKLKLNQKPSTDGSNWTIPKIDFALDLDKLALAINQFQYQDMLLFLEAQERFTLSEKYLKYRPNLTQYRGHYKEWWHFSYNCILNEQVKRHRNNWSWKRMKAHRQLVREYREAWIHVRTEKTPNASVKKKIEEAEKELDVFNLNIGRQQAELEIDRCEELVRVEDQEREGWFGWAKSWFGGGGGKKTDSEESKIIEKLEKEVTPEEKERLFEAIDYQENTPPTDYPKHFVENRFNLSLNTVLVALEDVLEMRFTKLSAKFEQRPSANAMRFSSCVKSLDMCAGEQSMLTMTDKSRDWMCLGVETNPLEGGYDQMVSLNIAPIMLKYHAPAVNKAMDVFKPPESVRLHQLTTLAIARYEDAKARSATALQHMVDERKKLKLEIKIDPAILIVSAGGIFDPNKPNLVAELGQLQMKTLEEPTAKSYEHVSDKRLRSLIAQAYDNFQLSLSNLQLIFADSFDKCMKARGDRKSRDHLLRPTGMCLDVLRSTIDDIQLPMIRVFGELPDVVLAISDDRLVKLLELFNSIPRPEFEEEAVDLSAPLADDLKLRDRAKMKMIIEMDEISEEAIAANDQSSGVQKDTENKQDKDKITDSVLREQQIQFDLNLKLNEVGIIVNQQDQPFLGANIRRFEFTLRKRMFDMVMHAALGSLTVEMPQIDSVSSSTKTIYLIDNEMRDGNHLIDFTYKQATNESPSFKSEFGSNDQSMLFVFQILNFNLHKEALNHLLNFNNRLQRKMARIPPPVIDTSIQQSPSDHKSSKKRTPSQTSRQSDRSRQSSTLQKPQRKKTLIPARMQQLAKKLKCFVFQFRIHEIGAKLYARQNDIAGGIDPSLDGNAVLEFCAINIQKLNLDGQMVDDGSMRVNISLDAFTMDDQRKNTKLTRLMDKKDAKSSDQFIALKYTQNPKGDKFVDVLSSKFFLMLAPEFLGVLSTFFIFHPSDDEEREQGGIADPFVIPDTNNDQAVTTGGRTSRKFTIAAQQTLTRTAGERQIAKPATAEGTLTINCRIYEIEVILIEDSVQLNDSQAIILSFNAMLDAKNIDGVQKIQGGIQRLQVFSTYFAPEKRHLSNYPILKELDINIAGTIDEKQKSQKLAISMDTVAIRVSPAVIRLLSAVSTKFSEHQKKDKAKSSGTELREYPDYWSAKQIDRERWWWFTGAIQSDADTTNIIDFPEEAIDDESTESPKTFELAQFSMNRFVLTVEACVKDVTRPMIMLESSLNGTAQNWSSTLIAKSEARLQISYYNLLYNVWEPVIEPVLHEHEGWQSWKLDVKIGTQQEEEQEAEQQLSTSSNQRKKAKKELESKKALPPAKMSILVEATEKMEITITKSFLQLLNQLADSFDKAAKQISPPMTRQLPVNDTDLGIKVSNTETLKASFHFINTLPLPVQIQSPIQYELRGGQGVDIHKLVAGHPFVFTVKAKENEYEKKYIVPETKKALETIRLTSKSGGSGAEAVLCLGLNWSTEFSRTNLLLYAPYWMVNETGKPLAYLSHSSLFPNPKRSCCFRCLRRCCRKLFSRNQTSSVEILHPAAANPMVLPLNESDFESKKKAKVKIDGSEWSPDFPLDMAGSSGRVICKSKDGQREFEMTVDVQLGQSGLTKVVTISPFYLLQNGGKVLVEVREPNTNNWISVPPESVVGFWPVQKSKRKTLIARFPNTREESVQFPFTEAFEGFCKILNGLIGVYIVVSLSEESSLIHLEHFVPGMAPAILMNATKYPVQYKQTLGEWKSLPSNKMVPFAWEDSLNERKLEWKSEESADSDQLLRNRDTSYLPSRTDQYHYYVSFLNGRQRTVLFTDDENVSFVAHEAYEMEQPNVGIELCLHGIGISLVNNLKRLEVLYMAISPQPQQVAEQQKKDSQNGFWMHYRQTDHQTTLHVKLHNFQVDNQLPASSFPLMLAMVPQPKSVVKNAPKPFLECSFVMSQSEHSNIVQIKLLQALVQEFAIQVDRTLINELLDMIPKESIQTGYNLDSFNKDMELTKTTLNRRALQTRTSQAKAYYEQMHISPLMIHLSFSQGHIEEKEGDKNGGDGIQWEFLNLILKSVGITLTEIQDVTFKLAFFQREATFYNRIQLQSEIQSHYTQQFIKQLYVLVLGLDILGNPFGLVRDLRTGAIDLFYQPAMGAVTGPAEFVEGMTLGLSSVFSHTVGGVLGVASRITGTMGKGMAALTFDDEYQRRRLQARQQPGSFGEGLFRGVRGVVSGVQEGVSGVVSKPVEGAKKGGFLGGIKGLGKGMVGAVTRPLSGVVDLVTTTADTVKTAITNVESTKPIRPPRFISADSIVRPFVYEEAIGYKIFKETNHGTLAESDSFLTYGNIAKHLVVIITDKRIIEAKQKEMTGNWHSDWCPTYAEIQKPSWITPKDSAERKFGVQIKLKEEKGFSLFGSSKGAKGKIYLFNAEHIARRVFDRMLGAWENSSEGTTE